VKNNQSYNIGLDIGVGSVGWCVTDEENNILKKSGKNMWGSRIFSEANTAQERRNFRSSRRRLDRRKERINILQSLMQQDIENEYPNFLQMLKESSLDFEDKTSSISINGIKYNIFSNEKYTDQIYYKQFPTIYHLRDYLIKNKEKVDIRLVYLAIHHIIKYRGNFLYEGDFSDDTTEIIDKIDILTNFLREKYNINLKQDIEKIIDILKQKSMSKANKKDKLISIFEFDKSDKPIIVNVINAILGYAFDLNKIFDINLSKNKISFASDIENEEEIKQQLQDDELIYDCLNETYSWFILQDILKGKTYISEAFKEKYYKYAKDLKKLKAIYKEYFPQKYNKMFKSYDKNNYVAYTGKCSGKTFKKCKAEEFFLKLKKDLDELPDTCVEKEEIKKDIENSNFLRKINVTDNGAIPHQLHQKELEIILNNQSKYYKTLEENKDNILKLFCFRIPYYVGPLAKDNSNWAWVIRKNNDEIRPWNFEDVVDEDATAEEFIKRMTNKCTYILNENVIPKQSLLYSRFCVLNELNNIRINNHHIVKDIKKLIIERLFKTKKKITRKMLVDLLTKEEIKIESLTGLQDGENFMSNMQSYIDMEKILGKIDESNIEQCEKIIYWITIFEEKKILKRKIEKEYPKLSLEQINKLAKLKYTGWSRLSKKLLVGLKATDGESIMEKLEKTSLNFMQIINNDVYGFNKQLEKLMPQKSGGVQYNDIAEIPTSPANKRAIWQSISIVKEISKIMKQNPKNIFIEFARSEEMNKSMKDTRVKQLLKKYEEVEKQLKDLKNYDKKVYEELKQHQSDKTLTEKMYLYYIQNGKCLYSGKALNIDELSQYEVDHILPQSYIKDDSIDNKALVLKEENQRKKDNLLLLDEIINNRTQWWKSLLENGLISQTKYYRLIKRKMFETDYEREKFVQRQLVETRQITKYVTNLLKNEYDTSEIYAIRADLTHGFRDKYKIYKNRNINNYHHAHDAYILSVIGNTLNKYWNGTGEFKYSQYVKKYVEDDKNKYEKNGMILGFINKYIHIEKIKSVMEYKDCFVSRMLEEGTGAFYNQTLYSPKDNPTIQLKKDKNVLKYGGYSGAQKAYCIIFKYIDKNNKEEYQLIGVPIQVSYEIKLGKLNLEEYIIDTYLKEKKYSNLKIVKKKILINQEYLDDNYEPMRLCSDSEIRSNKELVVPHKISELVYLMNLDENRLNDDEKEKLSKGYSIMFNYFLEKLKDEYKIFESIYLKLIDKMLKFEELKEVDKKSIINGLISLMETGQGNLKSIGLTEREGRKSGQKFKTDRLSKMIFIDKSITGMYERRYKIGGLENSCS